MRMDDWSSPQVTRKNRRSDPLPPRAETVTVADGAGAIVARTKAIMVP